VATVNVPAVCVDRFAGVQVAAAAEVLDEPVEDPLLEAEQAASDSATTKDEPSNNVRRIGFSIESGRRIVY
jgi:hypothetical protein